jgi:hypothetical protein
MSKKRVLPEIVKRQVESIVSQLCLAQARELNLPFHKRIAARNGDELSDDFKINRHEIVVNARKFLSLKPREFAPFATRIVKTAEAFEQRRYEERARQIVITKAEILQGLDRLKRWLSGEDFYSFVDELIEIADPPLRPEDEWNEDPLSELLGIYPPEY